MEEDDKSWPGKIQSLLIFCLLVVFYTVTRVLNHAESYDSINYALFAENFPLGSAPDTRNILFHVINRIMFVTSEWLGFNTCTLEMIVAVSIFTGAASLILFARLMKNRFGVSSFSAIAGAIFLGLTYGYWRYTGAVEVYIPSIFLILCSVTIILKFLEDKEHNELTLLAAGVISGLAVLYYQPNAIALFIASFILFCSASHFFAFVRYSIAGALVALAGIVAMFMMTNGSFPSSSELLSYLSSRNSEFRDYQSLPVTVVKSILAFGHDLYAAHWTRTLDSVREPLNPLIPGCIYNFNVAVHAGKGIQHFTAIAAILLVPIAILCGWLCWIASRKWKLALPNRKTLFLVGWLGLMVLIVGRIDPGSFEAWIPALVPLAGLLTVWVIEPCYQMGKKWTLIVFLVMTLCYNFFGGAMIWRNTQGDCFLHKTAWIRQELTEDDVVILNEFDYRMVDYLNYYSDAQIVHLNGADSVTISRSHPDIHYITVDEFMTWHLTEQFRLFAMDDVLSPPPEIKSCRYGEDRFEAATKLANRIKENAVLVDSGVFGETYQIKVSQ